MDEAWSVDLMSTLLAGSLAEDVDVVEGWSEVRTEDRCRSVGPDVSMVEFCKR